VVALMVAADIDRTADAVVAECYDRGVNVVRFDLSDYPAELDLRIDDWSCSRTLHVRERVVDLAEVDAIQYRRPLNIVGPADGGWAPAHATRTLAGALYSAECLWINRPTGDLTATYKVHQLSLARALGLRTPRTVVTNDPATVRDLARRHRPLVFKLLHGALVQPDGVRATVITTVVTDDHLERIDQIRHTPCLFQEYIPKRCEIRLTVVGHTFFPVTIDSQSSPGTAVDWRAAGGDNLTYGDFIPVPDDVVSAVIAMMRRLGIVYGAFDFIVDDAGQWVFLEVNPMGQYLWLEAEVGIPISGAIADHLGAGLSALRRAPRVVAY
jgi:glutathione synthase/RimK-type ligase-like ATP-grasp enzyme